MIDRMRETETSGFPGAEDWRESALGYAAAVRERLALGGERIKDFVAREPVKALGIALGLGVVVGWMIKRR
jgi:hypothetical protein